MSISTLARTLGRSIRTLTLGAPPRRTATQDPRTIPPFPHGRLATIVTLLSALALSSLSTGVPEARAQLGLAVPHVADASGTPTGTPARALGAT